MSTSRTDHYFDISKSTNTFRSLLGKYKTQSFTENPKAESVQTILEMKKKQVEQRETDEEYLFNEMKENVRLDEEMKSMFGVKSTTKPKGLVTNIEKRIKNKTKMQKDKLIHKDYRYKPDKIKVVNQKIVLPLIFPKTNKGSERTNPNQYPNANSQGEGLKADPNDILPKVKLKLNQSNQFEYLAHLDSMRNEFNTISLSYEDYFEREKGRSKFTAQRFEKLKKSIDHRAN